MPMTHDFGMEISLMNQLPAPGYLLCMTHTA